MKVKNITALKDTIRNSPELKEQLLKDPEGFIDKLESPILDKGVFLTVVYIVGAALFICIVVAAIISLSPGQVVNDPDGNPVLLQKEINNFFVMIGSASIGALAGLLAPSPNE